MPGGVQRGGDGRAGDPPVHARGAGQLGLADSVRDRFADRAGGAVDSQAHGRTRGIPGGAQAGQGPGARPVAGAAGASAQPFGLDGPGLWCDGVVLRSAGEHAHLRPQKPWPATGPGAAGADAGRGPDDRGHPPGRSAVGPAWPAAGADGLYPGIFRDGVPAVRVGGRSAVDRAPAGDATAAVHRHWRLLRAGTYRPGRAVPGRGALHRRIGGL
ncbi:hypothetical protein D3C79_756780 [compost metagenome]